MPFLMKILNVQKNDDGKLTFKLEKLAEANNFDSSNSHEAIADVEVTMQLFELLKKRMKTFLAYLKLTQFLGMLKKN